MSGDEVSTGIEKVLNEKNKAESVRKNSSGGIGFETCPSRQ